MARFGQDRPVAANKEERIRASISQIMSLLNNGTNKVLTLRAVLPYAMEISRAGGGALLVVDPDVGRMHVVAKENLPNEVIAPFSRGELGNFLLRGHRLQIESEGNNPHQALLKQHQLKIVFGFPLRFKRRVLGGIVIGTYQDEDHTLVQEQLEQLDILAQVVALFLENVRLRTLRKQNSRQPTESFPEDEIAADKRKLAELEALLEAMMSAEEEVVNQNRDLGLLNLLSNELNSTMQLNQILESGIKQARNAMNASLGWCYLLENGVLRLYEPQGLSEQYIEGMAYLQPGNGAEGMAFARNEAILHDALLFHSGRARNLVQQEGLRTVAAVPLSDQDKPFGVLAVGDRVNRNWTTRDERMLLSICRELSQAVVNSRKFDEANEKVENWESDYGALQQANRQLTLKAASLELQIERLRQAERQMWLVLAASSEARRKSIGKGSGPEEVTDDRQVIVTLKRALRKLSKPERQNGKRVL
ncbi:MAG TPA: GAF domain-containing protein [Anaerolineae bacterium]|nr:GAF domain-containing protein [Anaerolineae bacterium]HMR64824.1 GAF domain-containing protein [Anaerolineae bacterium]